MLRRNFNISQRSTFDIQHKQHMPLRLSDVPTLADLYRSASLHPKSPSYFPPRASVLNQVSLIKGDITKFEVDAIVNAANSSLLGGGGVDGAIHSAAGPGLLDETSTLNGCEPGGAKVTGGYNLPAKYVIHAVGPSYSPERAANCKRLLESCYRTSLQLALANNCETVAFPCISTGVYGYPIKDATEIALKSVRELLDIHEGGTKLKRVIFVVFSDRDKATYEQLIPLYFPSASEGNSI